MSRNPLLKYSQAANHSRLPVFSVSQACRLFNKDTRSLLLTGIYLGNMAHDAGINAPLENLRRFADLIRADAYSEFVLESPHDIPVRDPVLFPSKFVPNNKFKRKCKQGAKT